MTVKIKMEVEPELIETLQVLNDEALAAICDDEMENRINYLEVLVKGWKKYRNVKHEHRRALFLMLTSSNKDALQKYERLVLYPKTLELDKIEEFQRVFETNLPIDVVSMLSTEELGADSSDVSGGEEHSRSSSPVAEERCPTELFEPVLPLYQSDSDGDEPIESKTPDTHTSADTSHKKLRKEHDKLIDHAMEVLEHSLLAQNGREPQSLNGSSANQLSVVPTSNSERYSQPRLDILRNIVKEMKSSALTEKEDVVKMQDDNTLAESILHAAEEVRKAIDHVEEVQAATRSNPKSATVENLSKLESQLVHSVALLASSETSLMSKHGEQPEKGNEVMSRGQKKRAKKAAKKAAKTLEEKQRIVTEKQNELRRARLATDALGALGMLSTDRGIPEQHDELSNINKILTEDFNLPLTEHEMQKYLEIQRSGQTFPEESEEAKIVKKFLDNEQDIHDILIKQLKKEAENNEIIMQKVQAVSKDLPRNALNFTEEEESWRVAKNFVIHKLEYWKKSTDPKAPHYVQMYTHFLANCTMNIAKLIVQFLPFESHPDADLEQTLLMQYQSGNFPGITDEIQL